MAHINESQCHKRPEDHFNVDVFMNDGPHRKRKIHVTNNRRFSKNENKDVNLRMKEHQKHRKRTVKYNEKLDRCSSMILSDTNVNLVKRERDEDVVLWAQMFNNPVPTTHNYLQDFNDVNMQEFQRYLQRKREWKERRKQRKQNKSIINNIDQLMETSVMKPGESVKLRKRNKSPKNVEVDAVKEIFDTESFTQCQVKQSSTNIQNVPPCFKSYLDEVNNLMDAKLQMFFNKFLNKKKPSKRESPIKNETPATEIQNVVNESVSITANIITPDSSDDKKKSRKKHKKPAFKNDLNGLKSQECQAVLMEDVTTQSSQNILPVQPAEVKIKRKSKKQPSLINIPEENASGVHINEKPEKLSRDEGVKSDKPKRIHTETVTKEDFKEISKPKKRNFVCETVMIVEIPPTRPKEVFQSIDDYIDKRKKSLPFKMYYGQSKRNKICVTASDCHKLFAGTTDTSDRYSEDDSLTNDLFIKSPPISSTESSSNVSKCSPRSLKIPLSPIASSDELEEDAVSRRPKRPEKSNTKREKEVYKKNKQRDYGDLSQSDTELKDKSKKGCRKQRYDLFSSQSDTELKKLQKNVKKSKKKQKIDTPLSSVAVSDENTVKKKTHYCDSDSSTNLRKRNKEKSKSRRHRHFSSHSDSEINESARSVLNGLNYSASEENLQRKRKQKKVNEYCRKEKQDKTPRRSKQDKTFNNNKKSGKKTERKTASDVKLSKSDVDITRRRKTTHSTRSKSEMNLDLKSNQSSNKLNSLITVDRFGNRNPHSIKQVSTQNSSERTARPLYQQIRNNCLMLTKDYKKSEGISAHDKRKQYDEIMKKRMNKKKIESPKNRQYEVRYITVDTSTNPQQGTIKTAINDRPKHIAVHYKKRTENQKDEAVACKIIETPKPEKSPKNVADCSVQNSLYCDLFSDCTHDFCVNDNNNVPVVGQNLGNCFFYPFVHDLGWKLINIPSPTPFGINSFHYTCNAIPQTSNNETIRKRKKTYSKIRPSYNFRSGKRLMRVKSPKSKKVQVLMVNKNFKTDESSISTTCQTSFHDSNADYFSSERNLSFIGSHYSCPALSNHEPMFNFLYDDYSEMLDILHPLQQQLTVTPATIKANNLVSSMKQSSCTDSHQSRKSSVESGYMSVNSRKYFSVANFFKRPNIAALFKPPEHVAEKTDVLFFNYKKNELYEKMAQECQSFVSRIRPQSEGGISASREQEFEEIPLSVILGKTSSRSARSSQIGSEAKTVVLSDDSERKPENIENLAAPTMEHKSSENFQEIPLRVMLCKDSYEQYSGDSKTVVISPKTSVIIKSPESLTTNDSLPTNKIEVNEVKIVFFKSNENLRRVDSVSDQNVNFRNFERLCQVYEKQQQLSLQLSEDEDFFNVDLLGLIREFKANLNKRRKLKDFFKRANKHPPSDCSSSIIQELNVSSLEMQRPRASSKNPSHFQMLASNAKRYYSLLVDAVRSDQTLTDELKVYGFLNLLERIENGDITIQQCENEQRFEMDYKLQVKRAFLTAYTVCLEESKKNKGKIGTRELNLIRVLVSRLNISSASHTKVLASYIGRGFIRTESHLKAALTYLIRTKTNDLNLQQFEPIHHEND